MTNFINTKSILTISLAAAPLLLEAAGKKSNPQMNWVYDNILFVLAALLMAGVGMTLWNLMNSMVKYQQKEMLHEQGIELQPVEAAKPSLLKTLYDKAWSLVPMDKENDIDLGHDYDGIRELDNSLPPWWLYTFYFCIVFAVGYLYIYHLSDIGNSQHEEYVQEMRAAAEAQRDYIARQPSSVDEENLQALTDASSLSAGQSLFKASCATCHGEQGQGGVGPNLTDPYWLHGGSISHVYKTIKNGVPEKGMIAWKSQLQPGSILNIASFILTLEGTNPPKPKAPEGDLYVPDPLSAN